eukprot:1718292-Prymnesium_polylepis.1
MVRRKAVLVSMPRSATCLGTYGSLFRLDGLGTEAANRTLTLHAKSAGHTQVGQRKSLSALNNLADTRTQTHRFLVSTPQPTMHERGTCGATTASRLSETRSAWEVS